MGTLDERSSVKGSLPYAHGACWRAPFSLARSAHMYRFPLSVPAHVPAKPSIDGAADKIAITRETLYEWLKRKACRLAVDQACKKYLGNVFRTISNSSANLGSMPESRKQRGRWAASSERSALLPPKSGFEVQNLTGGPCHVAVRGRARAIACSASHQPSQALRPGRHRQKLSRPLHFA